MTKVFDSLPVCVQFDTFKSSRSQMFFKIGVPKNFAYSLENTGLKVCNFTKTRLEHRCFPVNIVKF